MRKQKRVKRQKYLKYRQAIWQGNSVELLTPSAVERFFKPTPEETAAAYVFFRVTK